MAGLGFDDKMPRLVSAKTHAVIDYLHVATNFVAAAMFFRKNKPAGIGAAILGARVLANALMTDYELGVFRLYSFKVHGMLDYGVAATSALIPTLFGITDTPEAKFFHIQGAPKLWPPAFPIMTMTVALSAPDIQNATGSHGR